MVRLNNDDQFKFLISCIRYSNNGKVDFTEVAQECGIVTKGAAAKRYERMMKAHGIHQPSSTARDTAVPPLRPKGEAAGPPTTSKKRKLDKCSSSIGSAMDDDDEYREKAKEEQSVGGMIKHEPVARDDMVAEDYSWMYQPDGAVEELGVDDTFDGYLTAPAFEPGSGSTGYGTLSSSDGGEYGKPAGSAVVVD